MLTTIAYSILSIVTSLVVLELLIALFIIFEGVINLHVGLRSGYIKFITKVLRFGQRKVDTVRPEVESSQFPERTWNAFAASSDILEDEPNQGKALEVEVDDDSRVDDKFQLNTPFALIRSGLKYIVEDEVTKAFDAEELPYWNLLTRTNKGYQYISMRLSVLWWLGFFFRHFFLFPIRLIVCIFGMCFLGVSAIITSKLKPGTFKDSFAKISNLISFRLLARSLTLYSTYHNRENRAKRDGICVANHTSPIDVVVLSCDNVYSFVGQLHTGPFRWFQLTLAKAFDHIWFERAETKDRTLVAQRMRNHVQQPTKPPILIFPEGACVNNTSVMMFKKGSFEVDTKVYPVAIRYNAMFGDPFWGLAPSMPAHIWDMITSWAIVCDVWYLPPMTRQPGEDATAFAGRVRLEIAKKGGLVDIDWDPRFYPENKKVEDSRWRKQQQKVLSEHLVRTLDGQHKTETEVKDVLLSEITRSS